MSSNSAKNRKQVWLTASVVGGLCSVLYFVSWWLPALYYSRDPAPVQIGKYPGFALLLLGWMEALSGSTCGMAWMANPCFAVGILALIRRQFGWATLILGVACGLASASFGVKSVCIDQAGSMATVLGFGPGFWVWYWSMATSFVASFLFWILSPNGQKPVDPSQILF